MLATSIAKPDPITTAVPHSTRQTQTQSPRNGDHYSFQSIAPLVSPLIPLHKGTPTLCSTLWKKGDTKPTRFPSPYANLFGVGSVRLLYLGVAVKGAPSKAEVGGQGSEEEGVLAGVVCFISVISTHRALTGRLRNGKGLG